MPMGTLLLRTRSPVSPPMTRLRTSCASHRCSAAPKMQETGRAFAAVVVRGRAGSWAKACHTVLIDHDPTLHGEVAGPSADACKGGHLFRLSGCDIFTSCEPCEDVRRGHLVGSDRTRFYANALADKAT